MKTEIILGGPGTGKTTYLMNVLDIAMQEGILPHRIAFMSFTKKAATEAMNRACEKFNVTNKQFPYFKTIHSLAYSETGVTRNDVMQPRDHKQIANKLGLSYTGFSNAADGAFTSDTKSDTLLSVVSYANATCQTLKEAWHETGGEVDWFRLKQYADTLKQYKSTNGKVDFDDMLQSYLDHAAPLDIDVAIIDEAQDLSAMQWLVVKKLCSNATRVLIAGDDDQAIYRWSGADVDQFVGKEGDVTVLPISYRLPKVIHQEAERLVARIKNRREKVYKPTDKHGNIEWITDIDENELNNGETWFMLARNSYTVKMFTDKLRELGVPYNTARGSSIKEDHVHAIVYWERLRKGKKLGGEEVNQMLKFLGHHSIKPVTPEGQYDQDDLLKLNLTVSGQWNDVLLGMDAKDINYYLDILRNGYKLTAVPLLYAGTIHSVKGGEADNVVLCTDVAYRTFKSMEEFEDDEHRVFYVGATRAKKNLYYMQPKTTMFYRV